MLIKLVYVVFLSACWYAGFDFCINLIVEILVLTGSFNEIVGSFYQFLHLNEAFICFFASTRALLDCLSDTTCISCADLMLLLDRSCGCWHRLGHVHIALRSPLGEENLCEKLVVVDVLHLLG